MGSRQNGGDSGVGGMDLGSNHVQQDPAQTYPLRLLRIIDLRRSISSQAAY